MKNFLSPVIIFLLSIAAPAQAQTWGRYYANPIFNLMENYVVEEIVRQRSLIRRNYDSTTYENYQICQVISAIGGGSGETCQALLY